MALFRLFLFMLLVFSNAQAGSREQNYYHTYWNPSYHGPHLDYCLDGVKQCGLPVANHYCRLMGYDHAVQQAIAYHVGQTQAFSCRKPCKGWQCNGFQLIRCVAQFNHKPVSSYYYRSRDFVFPRYEHSRVDWCYEDGKGCGKRAASSFCRRMGYSRAQNFKMQHHVNQTRALGNHRVCVGGECNGFSRIRCYR